MLLAHLQLRLNSGKMSTTPDEPESIYLELQGKTGTYQDYDDIVGEAATKVKVDENHYQKYTKREQTPSVSENAVQEDLRKLRANAGLYVCCFSHDPHNCCCHIRICRHDEVVWKQRFKCIKKHGAR